MEPVDNSMYRWMVIVFNNWIFHLRLTGSTWMTKVYTIVPRRIHALGSNLMKYTASFQDFSFKKEMWFHWWKTGQMTSIMVLTLWNSSKLQTRLLKGIMLSILFLKELRQTTILMTARLSMMRFMKLNKPERMSISQLGDLISIEKSVSMLLIWRFQGLVSGIPNCISLAT